MRRYTLFQNVLEKLTILLLLVVLVWVAARYGSLPDEIPTHFDFHGNVGDYGRKSTVWIIYGLAVLMTAGMLVAGRLMPVDRRTVNLPWNVPAFAWPALERLSINLFLWISLELVPIFAVPAITLTYGYGGAVPILVLVAVLIGTCVYYTIKMYRVCKSI